MMTGTNPIYHGVHDNINYKLGENNLTLAEVLKEEGYTTAAFVSSFVLNKRFGLAQGFDLYNDQYEEEITVAGFAERRGEETSRLAIKWLEEKMTNPFFLFLHYYDPHLPYDPPEPFASDFKDSKYAGEIAYTDYWIGQVIEKLKQLDLYDNSLLIITGDHGESLGEHGEKGHTFFIYQPNIKIPLIIKPPGQNKSQEINSTVGLTDIAPTIMRYLGIAVPESIQGEPLQTYFNDHKARYVYSESLTPTKYNCSPLLGLTSDQWKYIYTTEPELYNLVNDPDELKNLARSERERAEQMKKVLLKQIAGSSSSFDDDSLTELDQESLAKLESLGYLGVSLSTDSFEVDLNKNNPRDFISVFMKIKEIFTFIREEKYDQAKTLCLEIQSENPELLEVYRYLGNIAYEQGHFDEAFEHYDEYVKTISSQEETDLRIRPDLAKAIIKMGKIRFDQDNLEGAETFFREALQYETVSAEVYNNLSLILFKQGAIEESAEHYITAVSIDPELKNPEVYDALGRALAKKEKYTEAIEFFGEILTLDPNDAMAHANLAIAFKKLGKLGKTAFHYEEALKIKPDWFEIEHNLAWLLATSDNKAIRDPAKAVSLAESLLTTDRQPAILDILAAAHAGSGDFEQAISIAEKAVALAYAEGNEIMGEEIEGRIKLYKQGLPYHE